jgi:beta-aspartyl-peptidase (threonine type)
MKTSTKFYDMKYLVNGLMIACLLAMMAGCTANESNGMQESDANAQTEDANSDQKDWAIVIHGGAGTISKDLPDSVKQSYMADLDSALAMGEDALKGGGKAMDVVEKVIIYLENNPKFNAGKGAVFTSEGGHELDAAIMNGNTREAGTITGVTTVKNPISLARLVMEDSKHIMFSGEGAEEFAGQTEVERVNQDYFYTENRYQAWKRAVEAEGSPEKEQSTLIQPDADTQYWEDSKYGTVGCVVLDSQGTLVAGTSTGGMTNKKFGRVGDVPIIGSGTYASDEVAVSMTGWGEKIMLAVSGKTVSDYLKFKESSLEEAGEYLLNDVLDPDDAGMIAVDKHGNTFMNMNTTGMFRGKSDSDGEREVAIWE